MKDNLRTAFGNLGEMENLEPQEMQVTPPARMMHCDACSIPTRHERSESGAWVCWCGYDQSAAMLADEQAANMIEATARMIGGMRPDVRVRWIGMLGELLCSIPGAKQAMIDAVGRYDF